MSSPAGGSAQGKGLRTEGRGLSPKASSQPSVLSPQSSRLPVVVGISGASGAALARQTILRLGRAGYPVIVTCSRAGQRVWREELDEGFDAFVARCQADFSLEALDVEDIGASIASGRRLTLGMLVVPCSMDTLSAIATGRSTNLLERAADVTMKEGRTLTLVPRESPLSPIHLENLWKLSRLGVRVVLPVPAFYLKPTTLDEVVDDVACRAIGTLGIRDLSEELE